ncbi:hypothetical protein KI387_013057, partial [Taxus chinensis]
LLLFYKGIRDASPMAGLWALLVSWMESSLELSVHSCASYDEIPKRAFISTGNVSSTKQRDETALKHLGNTGNVQAHIRNRIETVLSFPCLYGHISETGEKLFCRFHAFTGTYP